MQKISDISYQYMYLFAGFSFLFSVMEPVPWEVKLAFHIFGGATFIVGLLSTVFTALAGECVSTNT